MAKDKNVQPLPTEQPNALCRRCVRTCRQSEKVLLLDCPRFVARPFKVAKPPGRQLELFGKK
ncbi:hypothetical protein [Geoalkalibacter halelectricus]|uniref:4Fe-4S ferredoxin-type domain-containing protein n=1 Tax=Geoalkalibacter halelectricus TaxID=2847045 RepID=A0ABY5ZQL2_9BACT|nr:hypothetical protein [Geoalkalibacter halelectricus]MDO3378498.1 hypothetical protein [Geoalkalibacter halelectricus]UWZ80185.1 hypothetical protein L9S41_02020 [Geoalkalibacter halelectricus]